MTHFVEDAAVLTAADHVALAIWARNLSRIFGDVIAVDGIDLEIPAGEIFGLLGPDGAGKSTLIRMLATMLAPDGGDAEIFGESVSTSANRVTPRIGYMSQRFSMYPDLTVAENLDFFATIRGVSRVDRRQRAAALLDGMGLAEFSGRQARHLSGGMKQKLMLAATLMHEPDLLLLDEPTTGVDPVSRREFWRILAGLHRTGKTVLVATPYMDEAERCTSVAFMDRGRIRYRGTPGEIKALVPGTLFEVDSTSSRDVLSAVVGAPGVASAHVYGDVVRVLWQSDADGQRALAELLHAGDVGFEVIRAVSVDMESAFMFLAQVTDLGPSAGEVS